MEHATVNNLEEEANKLLQDVAGKSGKEVHPESHSTFHTLAVKACGISSKSGLIAHKSVPSGLLSCLRLKQRAVSSYYSGGFGYIFCPPQLHEQRVNNAENINLQDAVLTTNPVLLSVALSSKPRLPRINKLILKLRTNSIVEETYSINMMFLRFLSS